MKKFLTFILIIALIMPFSALLAGCGNSKNKENYNNDTIIKQSDFVFSALNEAERNSAHTIDLNFDNIGQKVNYQGIDLKIDDGYLYYRLPDMGETYYCDNYKFSIQNNELVNISEGVRTSVNNILSKSLKLALQIGNSELTTNLDGEGKTYNYHIDFLPFLTKLNANISTNGNIYNFINQLFCDCGFDYRLNDILINVKKFVNDNTTMNQLIEFLGEKYNLDIIFLVAMSNSFSFGGFYGDEVLFFSKDSSQDRESPLLSSLNLTKSEFNYQIEQFFESLKNEKLNISSINCKKLDVDIQIKLNNANNLKNYDVKFNFETKEQENNISFDLQGEVRNIGTTELVCPYIDNVIKLKYDISDLTQDSPAIIYINNSKLENFEATNTSWCYSDEEGEFEIQDVYAYYDNENKNLILTELLVNRCLTTSDSNYIEMFDEQTKMKVIIHMV